MKVHDIVLNCQAIAVWRYCKIPCTVKHGKIGGAAVEVHTRTTTTMDPWWLGIR